MFRVHRLSEAIGAEIEGLDLSVSLNETTRQALLAAFFEHQVLVFRRQTLTPEQYIRVGETFGPLEPFFLSQYNLPEHPQIYVLSNVKQEGKFVGRYGAGMHWHSDHTFESAPASATLLYALEVPPVGGDTLFINNYAAYEQLPSELKQRLAGLQAIHHYQTKEHLYTADPTLSADKRQALQAYAGSAQSKPTSTATKPQIPDIAHPLVRTHPITGRKALYLNEAMTIGVVGMDTEVGQALLQELCDRAVQTAKIYRHQWQVGDVVVWDNPSMMHTGTYADPQYPRTLYRLTIQGSVPF